MIEPRIPADTHAGGQLPLAPDKISAVLLLGLEVPLLAHYSVEIPGFPEAFPQGRNVDVDGLETLRPLRWGYRPVMRDWRQGWQAAILTWAFTKRSPWAVSRSIWGVRFETPPP